MASIVPLFSGMDVVQTSCDPSQNRLGSCVQPQAFEASGANGSKNWYRPFLFETPFVVPQYFARKARRFIRKQLHENIGLFQSLRQNKDAHLA
jgi:hypothetical protein